MSADGITRRDAFGRCAALLGASAAFAAKSTAMLKAGIAEAPITPTWPTRLWGYDRSTDLSNGVLDDIYAKATLFESGTRRFLLITADLGAIGLDLSRRIARSIQKATGLPEDDVAIQVTHDHSAPAALGIPMTPADTRFQDLMEERMVQIAQEAQRNLTPVALECGQTDSAIALNRRVGNRKNTWDKDSGPIDEKFSVLLVRASSGKLLRAIVNYATHPVTLRADNYKVSADFPGVLYRRLGSELGCPIQYMQGCCGDVIPKVFGTAKEMESFGIRMTEEALRAVSEAKPVVGDSIDCSVRKITLNFIAPYTLTEFRPEAGELEKSTKTVPREWSKVYLDYLEKGGQPRQPHPTMVEAFRIGDVHIALLPGEVLHLTSLLIRAQFPDMRLLLGSYANDTSTGYLPHAVEFPRGGYEVNTAWQLYGILKTAPEMEATVRETAIELLRESVGRNGA